MVIAFVLIRVGAGEHLSFMKSVREEIVKIKGVKKVYAVFGRYDLIVLLEAPTLEELSAIITDKIRAVEGVQTTESLVGL